MKAIFLPGANLTPEQARASPGMLVAKLAATFEVIHNPYVSEERNDTSKK
jgi:hypothetical protein